MINIYKFLGLLLIPFIKINVRYRILKGKEISERYKERYGITSQTKKNNKKLLWIHAASVGEFKSTDYFISNYHQKYNILITTTTVSAANYAINTYGDKIIHQFAPLDVTIWVKRFLKKWQPTLIIWVESDLWPTTLSIIKQFKINAILVNVRLSPKSLKRWELIPSFYDKLLKCFIDVYAQSKCDLERIKLLSDKKIQFIGNLKLTSKKNIEQKNIVIKLKKEKKLFNIILASTHKNEEELIISSIREVIDIYKNIQLIVAPRHPERSEEVKLLCEKYKLNSVFETKKTSENTKVIIIDSFGILKRYFALSDIVILGGSFIPAGGHNPVEPALNKCAIITGPEIFNWEDIFKEMIKINACIKIESIKDLKNKIKKLIDNKNIIEIMKTNAYNFSQKQFIDVNILDETIKIYMNK